MTEPRTGRFLASSGRGQAGFRALARGCLLALACVLAPALAHAQMLRGSFETLPGADDDFSPYALGPVSETAFAPAPDTAFTPPPGERAGPEGEPPPPLAEAAPAERRKIAEEDDPYAQLGIRAGAFLIKPSVTVSGGYDSNPASSDPAEGSSYWRTRGVIDLESDWIRHAFRGRIEAGYRAFDEFPERDAPDYAADAALRLDVRRDLRVDIALRGAIDSDTRNDPELVGVTTSDENTRLSGSAGFVWKPNRISVGLTGEADRREFGDPDLADREYTQYEARLRTGYELSPALEPFVELSANERVYDLETNDNGVEHDSKGYRVYAGARFEPNPIWALEAKIGYGHQEAQEEWIPELTGLVAQGSLIWRPSVLTELRLNAERDFEASTVECCAIATRWRAGASFEHEFRRWLILTGDVSYEESFYETMDYTLKSLDAELALEYKFNRTVSALGSITYEKLDSTDDDEGYDATIFEVGLRVQR